MEIPGSKRFIPKGFDLGYPIWSILYFPVKLGLKNRPFFDADGDEASMSKSYSWWSKTSAKQLVMQFVSGQNCWAEAVKFKRVSQYISYILSHPIFLSMENDLAGSGKTCKVKENDLEWIQSHLKFFRFHVISKAHFSFECAKKRFTTIRSA